MKPINPSLARIAKFFVPVWWLLARLSPGDPAASTDQPSEIVVFDFHLLGDIVLLTPFLAALRAGFPGARITLVAGPWAAELLLGTNLVDALIPFSAPWVKYGQGLGGLIRCAALCRRLRAKRFDLGIEMRGDVRQIMMLWLSGVRRRLGFDFTGGGALLSDVVPDDGKLAHLAEHHQRMAAYLGIWPEGKTYSPWLKLTEQEARAIRNTPSFVGLHFDASLPLRRFPLAEIQRLMSRLLEHGERLCVFVPPGPTPIWLDELQQGLGKETPAIEFWSGTLREMVVKLASARHVYAMDSGPAHIAAALGVPVTVFFGPAEPDYVRPLGERVRIISRLDVPCRPCDQVRCTHSEFQFCLKGLAAAAPLPAYAGGGHSSS